MSRTTSRGDLEFAAESGFCEVSTTYGSSLAFLGELNFDGLVQDKVDSERTTAYANDGTMPIRGHKSNSEFTTDFWLPGHGSATSSGSVTIQEHEYLLGYALGASATGGAAGTATGGTATVPTTATESFIVGQLGFFGAKADGRADGQAGVVGTDGAGSLTLLSDLPAAMNNGDVIYAATQVYFNETPSALTMPSVRWRGLTPNQQYAMRGCFAKNTTITGFNPGEKPRASINWGVADWDPVSATYPSANSKDAFNPAPSAGGSLVIESTAVSTRTTYAYRDLVINIAQSTVPVMGPGGLSALQAVVGAVRGPTVITWDVTVDCGNVSATPTWPGRWDSDSQFYQLLLTASGAANGKQVAAYSPRCCLVGRKPVQMSMDGIARERLSFRAYTNTVTTSELTLSALRLAFG